MIQNQEQRHDHYDRDLDVDDCPLSGFVQIFPNHVHEFYVIGFVEGGKRHLWCKNQECDVSAGDLILFNPRDNHCCAPVDGELLDYRAVNIQPEIMEKSVKEITGKCFRPYFTQNVVYRSDITRSVAALYDSILRHASKLEKEESLAREFYAKLRRGLAPKTVVRYTREAFLYAPGNVRVTLDGDIRAGSPARFLIPQTLLPALGGLAVVEVKYDAFLPEIVKLAVQVPNRQGTACSKYALCRRYD